MRYLALCLFASVMVCGGVGCGGTDGPPDLTVYFKTTPYANAACNAVDQRLAGLRPMRLYTNGSTANAYNHYVEVEVYAGGTPAPI